MRESVPPPDNDANAERGADNVIVACLGATRGENIHVLTWHADDVYAVLARAAIRAGATVRRIPIESFAALDPSAIERVLATRLTGVTASILLGTETLPTSLSKSIAYYVRKSQARHLHLPRIDLRVLGTSVRADPERIRLFNEKLLTILRRPARLHVTSEAGTAFDTTFGVRFPIQMGGGRPNPGEFATLPTGCLYAHPAQASGVFVADRTAFGTGLNPERGAVRRSPVRIEVVGGVVRSASCADPVLSKQIDGYLASHPNAPRVGLVMLSTNYLARSELGNDIHDSLLPGVTLSLGYTDSAWSGAAFDAPVQLRLVGRRQSVDINGVLVVAAGRFEDSVVKGIDPFR